MIPDAKLRLQCNPTNPATPTGCVVQIDDRLIAAVTLANVREIATRIDEMEVAAEYPFITGS
jgi:hypothetical protein